MDFKSKVIEHRIEKDVVGVIVWENNQFYLKYKDTLYHIQEGNSIVGAKKVYSLPSNDYHIPWTESIITKPELQISRQKEIQFWGKYKPGLKVKGTLINDLFYDKSYSIKYPTKSKR